MILLVSATRSARTGCCTGGAGIGCMAISWILLGTRRLASEFREILSTCSKMEAEECCSLPELGRAAPGTEGEGHEQESPGKQLRESQLCITLKSPRGPVSDQSNKNPSSLPQMVYVKLSLLTLLKNYTWGLGRWLSRKRGTCAQGLSSVLDLMRRQRGLTLTTSIHVMCTCVCTQVYTHTHTLNKTTNASRRDVKKSLWYCVKDHSTVVGFFSICS